MKWETFKNMYNQIGLTEEQKDGIYQELQAASEAGSMAKRVRFSVRAAVFAAVFLLSGMTVFAVGRFSLGDRLAQAMNPGKESSLTQEQEEFYAQYGQILDKEIETAYGTLRLEAALYDDYFLIIPYTYDFNTKDDDNKKEVAGISLGNIGCSIKADSEHTGFALSNTGYSKPGEDGITSGSRVYNSNENEIFEEGDVIQIFTKQKDLPIADKILFEFTLETKMERVNLTIDESACKILEEKGLLIDEISVSPISIFYSGISRSGGIIPVSIVLKDGSVIECSYGGSCSSNDGRLREDYPYLVTYSDLFDAPVKVDEIEGIRIKIGKTEVWIPMENL